MSIDAVQFVPQMEGDPLRVVDDDDDDDDDVAYKERHVILSLSLFLALGHEYQSNGKGGEEGET